MARRALSSKTSAVRSARLVFEDEESRCATSSPNDATSPCALSKLSITATAPTKYQQRSTA
eukprot:1942792-Pleurochrysis_carterae.AAC.1